MRERAGYNLNSTRKTATLPIKRVFLPFGGEGRRLTAEKPPPINQSLMQLALTEESYWVKIEKREAACPSFLIRSRSEW